MKRVQTWTVTCYPNDGRLPPFQRWQDQLKATFIWEPTPTEVAAAFGWKITEKQAHYVDDGGICYLQDGWIFVKEKS